MPDTSSPRLALYASVGAELTHYEVNVAAATLTRRATTKLPAMVQYVWPHASRRFVYAATSTRGPGGSGSGNVHYVTALRVDPRTGALARHGDPVALPARPIHLTADADSSHLLIAYNIPSSLTVHRIEADGTIGAEVRQSPALPGGTYAHQVRVTASNRMAVLVARGNDAAHGKPEDPGALVVFDYRAGALSFKASIAPAGGYGFGPRHIDFHPSKPWLYASIERQNQLMLFCMRDVAVDPDPSFIKTTLSAPTPPGAHQLVGTLHVHPNGRTVYVANRAYGYVEEGGNRIATGGENSFAVFSIDQATGEPTLVQSIDTHGFGTRTFAIDPSGQLLVAGNLMPLVVRRGATLESVPASLALFRIGADGRLEYLSKLDVDAGTETQFWSGLLALPDAAA